MKYLTLNLQGVMQYYAVNNSFVVSVAGGDGYYKTERRPTKNALVGMIGCVMGIPRKDERLNQLKTTLVFRYRVLKEGSVITDFQTVHGMPDFETKKLKPFYKASGKKSDDENGIIKNVQYLSNYAFEAYIGSEDEEFLKDIRDHFYDPVWIPYLGRKNCLPSVPIVTDGKILTEAEMEEFENVHDCP